MAVKTIDQNPTINDTVLFDILTPDADDCFSANPYIVNSVTIFYVERDFALGNPAEYDQLIYAQAALTSVQEAVQLACDNPTPENIEAAKVAQQAAASQATVAPVYFNEATPIAVIGNADFPAWLSTDPD